MRPSLFDQSAQSWLAELARLADSAPPGDAVVTVRCAGLTPAGADGARECLTAAIEVAGPPAATAIADLLAALGVDHDHATGKVRGLLCSLCNRGIGFLKDDPALVRSALNYLENRT